MNAFVPRSLLFLCLFCSSASAGIIQMENPGEGYAEVLLEVDSPTSRITFSHLEPGNSEEGFDFTAPSMSVFLPQTSFGPFTISMHPFESFAGVRWANFGQFDLREEQGAESVSISVLHASGRDGDETVFRDWVIDDGSPRTVAMWGWIVPEPSSIMLCLSTLPLLRRRR